VSPDQVIENLLMIGENFPEMQNTVRRAIKLIQERESYRESLHRLRRTIRQDGLPGQSVKAKKERGK
jgi:hypothetical protein